jgi:hypothetical protein
LTAALLLILAMASQGLAWANGHGWIRQWAVQRLPERHASLIGEAHLHALSHDYTSLQDRHASGRRPDLDPYCRPPAGDVSLHDVNDTGATFVAVRWYLQQVRDHVQAGKHDEAMKYLGVLCHWMEDPSSPSMHASPVDEMTLRELLPPPPDMRNTNYLYGAGWIDLEGNDLARAGHTMIPDEPYEPRLLGTSMNEAAARITIEQREIRRRAAGRIIELIQARIDSNDDTLAKRVGAALLDSAQLTCDVIHTAACLAADETLGEAQPLSLVGVTPHRPAGLTAHPYYAIHYLANQAMSADRQLHSLQFAEQGFGVGAPVSLRFTVPTGGVYRELTTRVGLHPTAGPNGAVVFKVLIDGRAVATSTTIRSGDDPVRLSVAIPDVLVIELTLQTVAVDGSNPEHNLGVWGDPLLLP